MKQITALNEQLKDREENKGDVQNAQVFLENGTLMLIKDDRTALRRLDLENCNVMQIPSAPDFKLYYRTGSEDMEGGVRKRLRVQIVAISKNLNEEEEKGDLNLISNVLKEKLNRWNKELELRTEIAYQQERIRIGNEYASTKLPTLLSLLSALCSDKVTTGEQRKQIRDVINLFLMGEIRYDDIFLIFAQILGDEVLHHLITSLEGPLDNDGSLDFSWMARSFEFKKEISPFERLLSYTNIQNFLMDSVKLYPLNGFDPKDLPNVGYSSVRCGPYLIFLGGIKSSRREQGTRSIFLHSFDKIKVLNTETLKVSGFNCSGPIPKSTIHHSSNLLMSQSSPKILLSGGLYWDESTKEFKFSDTTSVFDMKTRSWNILDGCANTPRFLHTSLTYPQYSNGKSSKFIIVFGGLTKSLTEISPSNDLWVFSTKFNSWTQVAVLPAPNSTQTELPMPRFGHSMAWVSEKTFFVYGGESRKKEGDGNYAGVLLNDIWSFTINSSDHDIENLNIRGHWTKISSTGSPRPPSSLHACISLSFLKNDSKIEKVTDLILGATDDSNSSSQMLFIGGCASPLIKSYPIYLNDQETASEDNKHNQDWFLYGMEGSKFELHSKNVSQIGILDINSNKWASIENLKVSNPSPTNKSILTPLIEQDDFSNITILGGTSLIFETTSINKNTTIPCILLQMLDQSMAKNKGRQRRFFALSLLGIEPYCSSAYNEVELNLKQSNTNLILEEPTILESVSKYLKPKPNKNFSISTSIFSPLSSSQNWIFGAIAHLADNSFSTEVNSSIFEISICRNYISVIDNGSGLLYKDLSRLFRHFGTDSCGLLDECPSDSKLSSPLKMYGIGFKHAFSRLSDTCMVFTKTSNFIGVGLISKSIMNSENLVESRYWTPICYWYSDTMKPLIPKGSSIYEHEENQKLILKYGFVKDPSLFCDHFNSIDSCSGTKMMFSLDAKYIKLHPAQYLEISDKGMNLLNQEKSLFDSNHFNSCMFSIPEEETLTQSFVPASSSISPFWNSERFSIDYSLATYLSWLYLNKTQKIFCQGKLLSHDNKSESLSLYDFLTQNLKHSVELSRIYKNGSNDGAFALIGKLSLSPKNVEQDIAITADSEVRENNAECPNNILSADPEISKSEQIFEAGILLYYNGRLIRRLEHAFPNTKPKEMNEFQLTAIINVPNWLKPASNKQEFVLERTGIFEEFQDHIRELISAYMNIHRDQDKLKAWGAEFNNSSLEDSSLIRPNKIPKLEE
ncbi:kelch repeat-containing s that is fused to a HSP90-like ATpase [Cryptosporidium sp. chipmunk genotype I]|uniref:kelch repeat-containing s that is fused to a HSP90-like ATpase n=1 Tax=Cryptosporidium sp. chipmunk genotype I TaxID=1280935 RepID=UPI00351A72DC|nr:kelch repeat-containing s that is fused to a HSP90-like ATpase [Cryptosporidium sp. chipmunk genotype I]